VAKGQGFATTLDALTEKNSAQSGWRGKAHCGGSGLQSRELPAAAIPGAPVDARGGVRQRTGRPRVVGGEHGLGSELRPEVGWRCREGREKDAPEAPGSGAWNDAVVLGGGRGLRIDKFQDVANGCVSG